MRGRLLLQSAALVCGAALAACGKPDPAVRPEVTVDLRADVNRNGTVDLDDPTEDADEDTWDEHHGAIFLANIDDDEGRCPKSGTDVDLAACHDGADEVVNGPDDLLDLARLKTVPWPAAPSDAVGRISVSDGAARFVRLFWQRGGEFVVFNPDSDTLSPGDLKAGVELAIEGTDVVRDAAVWDGYADVTLTVESRTLGAPVSDTVRLRQAPIILRHHLDPPETVYVSSVRDPGLTAMANDLSAALTAAGIEAPLVKLPLPQDQWTQDLFESGYMAMPAPGGMHVIRVNLRSANLENPRNKSNPQRSGGKVVFTALRGKDVGGIAAYDLQHDPDMDTLDSFGNTETIPPYSHEGQRYPLGRVFRGSTESYHPDPKMSALIEAQAVQPPVYVDTSWLLVGHVDETITFVKANTPRGWALVVNDAAMAKAMLEQQVAAGRGDVKIFVGRKWLDDNDGEYAAEATISQVLADSNVMSASAEAAIKVDEQVEVIKRETGITDDEILHLPFLHWNQYGASIAYQVGTINGISLGDGHFAMAEPHGPIIDGSDLMKVQAEAEFAKVGIAVHWIEDWDLYHRLMGEVHCGSNMTRKIPANVRWWESGR